MHVSAAALLVSACLCVCVCASLFACVCLSTQRCFCCAFLDLLLLSKAERARKPFSSSTWISLVRTRTHTIEYKKKKCIAFASPLDAAQSRSTLAFALASLLFPLSKVTEAQPKTCTQFHTHTGTHFALLVGVCVCVALLFAYFAVRRMFVYVYVSWEWRREYSSFVRYGNCVLAPILLRLLPLLVIVVGQVSIARDRERERSFCYKLQTCCII